MNLKLDYSRSSVADHELQGFEKMIEVAHTMLHEQTGLGSDFLGWVDLPVNYDKEEFARIKSAAKNNSRKKRMYL